MIDYKQIFTSKNIAYLIIGLGIAISLVAAVVPHAPGAFRLSWGLLFWGLVPYIVYLFLTEMLTGAALVVPGVLIFLIDFYAQIHLFLFPDASTDSGLITYLPLWLTLIVLPIGWYAGKRLFKKEETQKES